MAQLSEPNQISSCTLTSEVGPSSQSDDTRRDRLVPDHARTGAGEGNIEIIRYSVS